MRYAFKLCGPIALAAAILFFITASGQAALITNGDIYAQDGHEVGSGNGTLDFILLTDSNGGSGNSQVSFNGDDSNTAMPKGGSSPTANTTFVTSFGELRAFYRLNFPNGLGGSTVNQMVLFFDINQTGGVQYVNLDKLTIYKDYNQIYGDNRDNPHLADVSKDLQNATGTNFSGGTQLATLDSTPKPFLQQNVGAGHADYVIFTHVNPFDPAFSDSTRFLLHWESSLHDSGGETIFLSGTYGPFDGIPEPATLSLLGIGACLMCVRGRHVRR